MNINLRSSLSRKVGVFLALVLVLSVFTALPAAAYAEEGDTGTTQEEILTEDDTGTSEEGGSAEEESASEEEPPAEEQEAVEEESDEEDSGSGLTIGPGTHITSGGTYQIDSTATGGTIYLDTSAAVTLVGNGTTSTSTPNAALTIDATVAGTSPNTGANLTLQSVWISSPYSGGNVINFTGTGNTLSVANGYGAILESSGYSNLALLHVAPGTSLTLNGPSTANTTSGTGLYLYKHSGSSAVGGNSTEASGAITFASGYIFVKGSQAGAVIGGNGGSGTYLDQITFSGAFVNIEANAHGAGIGAGSYSGCAGDVTISGGNVAITCDYAGPAIGNGDGSTNTHELEITGGSLLVTLTQNSIEGGLIPSAAINADFTEGGTVPFVYKPADPAANTVVQVDDSGFYSGVVK